MEAEVRSAPAGGSERLPWYAIATLTAVLPAAGAGMAIRGVVNTFRGMAVTGSGGNATIAVGLYESNRPLIAAAVVAAALAAWLWIAVVRRPERAEVFPGLLFSLAPVLACIPAVILWITESFALQVLRGVATGSIGEISQRMATLVTTGFAAAILIIPLVIAAFAIALARPRPRTRPDLPPAAIWAAVTVLLAVVAIAFYLRTSYLREVAITGQL